MIRSKGGSAEDICFACGLCCNGVIFGDVNLQRRDNAARLRALGLQLAKPKTMESASGRGLRFHQPCNAYDGCRCRVYAGRPEHCKQFECLLLKGVRAGETAREAALRTIRQTRNGAQTIKRLLRELGDTDEGLDLAARFRRTAARLEDIGADKETGRIFGQLTLRMHGLNFVVAESFYPGA